MLRQPVYNTPVYGHGCMDDLITKRSFESQATLVIGVLGSFVYMSSMGVWYWQTSGRLV